LNNQNDQSSEFSLEQTKQVARGQNTRKKLFVEPTVSVPVDVLEATTNFLFLTAEASVIS
jgi:hypothetical protein